MPCDSDQQRQCDRRFDQIDSQLRAIHDAVIGTADKPGLGERVRVLVAAESSRAKIKWALVTAFLGQSVVLVGIAIRHLFSKSG
jgi:hypothetical protein